MGYQTTLNYIVKMPRAFDFSEMLPGSFFDVEKEGQRHYMMNCPLLLADHEWDIIGYVLVVHQMTSCHTTKLTCKLLFKLTPEESEVLSRVNQLSQLEMKKDAQRKFPKCPKSLHWASELASVHFDELEYFNVSDEATAMEKQGITIAYPLHNNVIQMHGKYPVYCTPHWNYIDNEIWIDEGVIHTNIRHVKFKTADGIEGIVFSDFDLVGFNPEV